jgi:Tfp pilus assembly protein PilN
MVGLNLLRFPTLERQQQSRRRWLFIGAGLVLGGVLAAGGLSVLAGQTEQLKLQTQKVQNQLAESKRAAQTRQQQQMHLQLVGQQLRQLTHLKSQQEAWVEMQSSLLDVIPGQGVRLQRLQVEAGRIDLQGHAAHVPAMSLVAQMLAERWGTPLHLQSVETGGAATGASAFSFAWQGQWSALDLGSGPSRKGQP